jgi:hypothetical protein
MLNLKLEVYTGKVKTLLQDIEDFLGMRHHSQMLVSFQRNDEALLTGHPILRLSNVASRDLDW